MPALSNQRHETFAQGLASGLTKTAAYLAIYPDTNVKAAAESASRLSKTAKIQERVAELNQPAVDAAVASAQWIVNEAVAVVREAKPKDRVPALVLLARLHPEFRTDVTIDARSQMLVLPEGTTLEDLKALRAGLDAADG